MSRMVLHTAIVCVFYASTSRATVIYVDRDAPGPVVDGSTWCTAFTELHEAVEAASAGDVIRVAEGTYSPDTRGLIDPREATFELVAGVTIEGAYAGCGAGNPNARDFVGSASVLTGDVNGNDGIDCCYPHGSPSCADASCQDMVCDDDPFCCAGTWDDICALRAQIECSECSASSDAENLYHVVSTSAQPNERGSPSVLDGFTIRRGSATGTTPHDRGGALYVSQIDVVVRNCIFESNLAGGSVEGFGGAVYVEMGSPTFVDCRFENYIAVSDRAAGGAVYNEGGAPLHERSEFSNNAVSGFSMSRGGATANFNGATPTFTECEFADNYCTCAGGASADLNGTHSTYLLSTFSNNESFCPGGAIFTFENSRPTVIGCAFKGNNSGIQSGGAIWTANTGITVIDSSFVENSGWTGAAIYLVGDSVVESCVFSNNDAAFQGGAINVFSTACYVRDCVFEGNYAERDGGAVMNLEGESFFQECAFYGNVADRSGGAVYSTTGATSHFECSSFRLNVAVKDGGAVLQAAPYEGTQSTAVGCLFIGNSAGEDAGAWKTGNSATAPLIRNSVFVANLAGNNAGAIFDRGRPNVESCLFVANSAAKGGAVYQWFTEDGQFHNCTFFGNTATEAGGGVYRENANTTFANSILWNNFDAGGSGESAQIFNEDNLPTIDFSRVQGWTGAMGGTGNSGEDPLFADPAGDDGELGTEDDDLRLSPESPAINAGDPDFVADCRDVRDRGIKGSRDQGERNEARRHVGTEARMRGGQGTEGVRENNNKNGADNPCGVDLDGHARVLCGRVDIGAYEFGIGDGDCDRDVDLFDFEQFLNCHTGPGPIGLRGESGPGGPSPLEVGDPMKNARQADHRDPTSVPADHSPTIHHRDPKSEDMGHPGLIGDDCIPFDFNADNDVDWHDLAGMQVAFSDP